MAKIHLRKITLNNNRVALLFVLIFGLVGASLLLFTKALGNGIITGVAFKDLNRNQIHDTGEEPFGNHRLYFLNATGAYIGNTVTDSSGRYSFSGLDDGNYTVMYDGSTWRSISNDWVPTTSETLRPTKNVQVSNGVGTALFGWRPIAKSPGSNPLSSTVTPAGLTIEIYNDAIVPSDVLSELQKGALLGIEQKTIKISIGGSCNCNATASGVSGTPGSYTGYQANINLTWDVWVNETGQHRSLFHEYGHAWDGYFRYIVQQDNTRANYLKARGLYGDPRINTSYGWDVGEIIAEDYRQLFGDPAVRTIAKINNEIPDANQVAGLEDYLKNSYTNSPSATLSAPSNLSGTSGLSAEGPTASLSWIGSTGSVNHYDVYRDGVKIGYVNAPSTTYYDGSGLDYSKTYTYSVKAVGDNGSTSNFSNSVTVLTPSADFQKPTAPGGLISPQQSKTSISLQWSASSDNVGIKEYRVYQERRKLLPLLIASVTDTSFVVNGLKSNTSYIFYVTAVDSAGNESLPSKTITVKTKR
jgi:chitodextrinase